MACNSSRRVIPASMTSSICPHYSMSRAAVLRRSPTPLRIAMALILGVLVWLAAWPAGASGNWQVVLAAGDDAEPVFDNATHEMSRRLAAAGVPSSNIHRLSASAAELAGGVESATSEHLLRRIADLPARPGDQCLVFLTSHGERGAGIWLARSDRALTPDELARALSRGCGDAPTVVIVSACYSGGFAGG